MSQPSSKVDIQARSPGALLLDKLRRGKRNRRRCSWPGSDSREPEFALVPLTDDELQDANAAALQRMKELGIDLTVYTADDFNTELTIQVLARSMRCLDDDSKPFFSDAAELRSGWYPEERAVLGAEFLELTQTCNPDPNDLEPEQLAAIGEAVKKKDVRVLRGFGSNTLASYLLGMANPSST